MTHRARRRGPLTVAGGVAVLLALAACTTSDDGDDEPKESPSGGAASGTVESTPPPVPDVCALLDDAAVEQLVPDGSRGFVAQQSFEEAEGTCTVDNELPTTQNEVLVVRVTMWPTFDDDVMQGVLADRCGDVSAVVTADACAGTDGDAGQAHALDGTTVVSVELQNGFGAGVPAAELATLQAVAAEVLAAV